MKYKLLIILGVFLVSFAGVFVGMVDIEPSVVAMYRLGFCGFILLPFAVKHKDMSKVKFKDLNLILISGIVISLHYFTWFTSLNYTSVTSSTLIICTEPFVALLAGYLLYREKIARSQFIILLIAMIGVGIVAWGDIYISQEALFGDFITFVATIFFVIYLVIGQNIVKRYSFIIYSSLLFISSGLILLIYNLLMGYEVVNFTSYEWLILFLMATIPNAGQIIFNYTLKYVKPSLIAASILLEPIFATILAVILLNDKVYLNQYLGGLIIISSVYVYIKRDKVN